MNFCLLVHVFARQRFLLAFGCHLTMDALAFG